MLATHQLTLVSAFHAVQDNDEDSKDEEEDHYDNGHHHTNDNSSSVIFCRVGGETYPGEHFVCNVIYMKGMSQQLLYNVSNLPQQMLLSHLETFHTHSQPSLTHCSSLQ